MLRAPGSMTTMNWSITEAVPRPRCSSPASMSMTTTSSLRNTSFDRMALSITCSGHTQPDPPVSTVPMTSSFTPFTSRLSLSGRSETSGLSL